jgi:small subunit ribosomal protein S16
LTVDNAKALKWLKQGALPSERVKKLFEISGAWAEFMATKPAKPAKTAK